MVELNQIVLGDCLQIMKDIPDNYFELAIVDPPYGGGGKEFKGTDGRFGGRFEKYRQVVSLTTPEIEMTRTGGTWESKYSNKISKWDIAPTQEYFEELFRVSQNQIVWGGITLCYLRQGVFSFGKNSQ